MQAIEHYKNNFTELLNNLINRHTLFFIYNLNFEYFFWLFLNVGRHYRYDFILK